MQTIRRLGRSLGRKLGHLSADFYYERVLGIRTQGFIGLDQLGLKDDGSSPYGPTDWFSLKNILRHHAISAADSFLDMGCGKGRALIIAAGFPFKRIIGVDVSSALCEQARTNAARACLSVDVINADAASFSIPTEVTVIFLSNPFDGKIFDGFLTKLKASLEALPRELTLIYQHPICHEQVLSSGLFEEINVRPARYRDNYKVYRFSPAIAR